MKRYFQSWPVVAVLVVFLAAACSTQTKQISSWKTVEIGACKTIL